MTTYCRFAVDGTMFNGIRTGTEVQPTGRLCDPPSTSPIGPPVPADRVQFIAPCDPSKIVLVSKNYANRVTATGASAYKEPLIFLKPTSALLPPGGPIRLPAGVDVVSCEIELAAVIGRTASHVSVEDAKRYVLGYTLMFDLSAREIVNSEIQMTRGKGFDTFAPIADSIVSDVDPDHLALRLTHNGDTVVDTTTADMIFSVAQVVSFISSVMTLHPGDIICTGGAGADRPLLSPGDKLLGESPDIGTLAVSVVAE